MQSHSIDQRDYEGYGVYEYGAGAHSLGQAMPHLGSLNTYEDINGLAHVPQTQKGMAISTLEVMVFAPSAAEPGVRTEGTASVLFGQTGGPWVSNAVAKGNAVLVKRAAEVSGVVDVVLTTSAAAVALATATPAASWVIVDAPPALVAQAEALRAGGGVAPGLPSGAHPPPCTASESLINGMCHPIPGGVRPGTEPPPGTGPPPGTTPQAAPVAPWVYPAIGVGVVFVLGAAVYYGTRTAPRAYAPNRRRRRR